MIAAKDSYRTDIARSHAEVLLLLQSLPTFLWIIKLTTTARLTCELFPVSLRSVWRISLGRHRMARSLLFAAAIFLSGCVLAPHDTKQEQKQVSDAGVAYETAAESRTLPELPSPATWQDVLHRAFLANGELEAAYFEWKAALTRVEQAGAYPNSNLSIGFEYMFSSGRMKSWDRTTVSAGFDPSMTLRLPIKVRQSARVALEQAKAAGQKFRAAKFDLQRRVLSSYLDLSLLQEKLRIQRDNVELLKLLSESAASRVQAGAPQQDLLKAQIEHRLAENELVNLQAEANAMRAMLNGMLARDADAPLELPASFPSPRPVAADDATLIAVAVDANPELAGLAHQVQAGKDALELARLAYLPDISPVAGFTGSVSQFAGAMLMLPTNIPAIRGAVNEAGAMLRANQAMALQTRRDRAASFVAALYMMRNAERQLVLFEQDVLPVAEQALNSSRQAYGAGQISFADLIDSQRMLLEVRLMIAEIKAEREKRLAEMESLAGVDIETLGQPATQPAASGIDS